MNSPVTIESRVAALEHLARIREGFREHTKADLEKELTVAALEHLATKADLEKELTALSRSLITDIRQELKSYLKSETQALRQELQADNRTQADRVIQAFHATS